MPFANPILAGTALVRSAIKSPNYAAGTLGWSINQDGTAEFNAGSFRSSVLIGGPPATGAVSIGLRGTDIPAVLRAFSVDYDTWYTADVYWYSATAFYWDALVHNAAFGLVERITGTYDTVNGVQLKTLVDGPGGAANAIHFGSDTYATTNKLVVDFRNANVIIDGLSSLNAENGVLKDGTAEAWHAATLQNGWTNFGAGNPTMRFRLVPSPTGCVQLAGLIAPGTKTSFTTVFTLPLGYRPTNQLIVPVVADNSAASAVPPNVAVQTNGNVNIVGCTTALSYVSIHALLQLDA